MISTTSDRGANIQRALKDYQQQTGTHWIPCALHRIQLCINNGWKSVKAIKDITNKCAAIAKFFRNNRVAMSIFTQERAKLGHKELAFVADNVTRWNSRYNMIRRVVQLSDALVPTSDILATRSVGRTMTEKYSGFRNNLLSADELEVLREVIQLLKGAADFTDWAGRFEHSKISQIYPRVHDILPSIETFRTKQVRSLHRAMKREINNAWPLHDIPDVSLLAMYFNPGLVSHELWNLKRGEPVVTPDSDDDTDDDEDEDTNSDSDSDQDLDDDFALEAHSYSDSDTNTDADHDADHDTDHVADHDAENLAKHVADHSADHDAEHVADHDADRNVDHDSDHDAEPNLTNWQRAEYLAKEIIVQLHQRDHSRKNGQGYVAAADTTSDIDHRSTTYTQRNIEDWQDNALFDIQKYYLRVRRRTERFLGFKDDPVAFWKSNELFRADCMLARVARMCLTMQATSSESERLFSRAGFVLSPRRSNLLDSDLQNVIVFNSLEKAFILK